MSNRKARIEQARGFEVTRDSEAAPASIIEELRQETFYAHGRTALSIIGGGLQIVGFLGLVAGGLTLFFFPNIAPFLIIGGLAVLIAATLGRYVGMAVFDLADSALEFRLDQRRYKAPPPGCTVSAESPQDIGAATTEPGNPAFQE